MAFEIKRRGKLTYYYRADRPVFSFVVTEAIPDGDLRVYLAGLPVRFTVHVIDVPDQAASYEFYTTALLQRASKERSG